MPRIPPGPQITDRDRLILRELFHTRIATREHLRALLFGDRRDACNKRIQKLVNADYIVERRQHPAVPGHLFLGARGLRYLEEDGVLVEYPWLTRAALERRADVSPLTVQHELEVFDIKVAFHRALIDDANYQLKQFVTWPTLMQFEVPDKAAGLYGGRNLAVYPDSYLELLHRDPSDEQPVRRYFLEHDRSQKVQERFVQQLLHYRTYYEVNGLAERLGLTGKAAFLLLVACRTPGRRNNTLKILTQESVKTHVWLTTYPELVREPLGQIWIRPADYQEATEKTPFDPWSARIVEGSDPERDDFVEHNVTKRRLLDF